MTIAITGATGHLGSQIIQELIDKKPKESLIAVVRNKEKAQEQFQSNVEIRQGDYNSYDSLVNAFQGVEKLLFISSPSNDDMERVIQHATVVKAARDAEVSRIYYTSFSGADQSAIPLAKLHLATEAAIKVSGLTYTFVRNPLYTDVFINPSLNGAVESGKLVSNTGNGKLNTVLRSDLAKATAELLSRKGYENEIVDFASSTLWSFDELAEALSEICGKTVQHQTVAYQEAVDHFADSGLPRPAAEFTASLYQAIAEGDIANTQPHVKELIREETPLKKIISTSL